MAARFWNKAPFIRLLIALTGGIVLERYLQLPKTVLLTGFGLSLSAVLLYAFVPVSQRYRFASAGGFALMLLLFFLGGILFWFKDVRNNPLWFGRAYHNSDFIVATIEEPLVEKAASYKAIATVQSLCIKSEKQETSGEIILYFKKDSVAPSLVYGSQILLSQGLQPIKNSGNPGGFDYETYSLFQGITHQVYLTKDDYVVLPSTNKSFFKTFIYGSRAWVVSVLRKYIKGEKEQGLAEALLIGYKDDLDKNLVQAYSNTGVVHIIAISGLHLGLIYWLLVRLTIPLKRRKTFAWPRFLLIVGSLWLFSILAGGGPSVLRSAVMFSVVALGELAVRKTSIVNSLALSAFGLLCFNPFWLWDVGFQLSYTAVLSIVLFFQPIYNWTHFQNKAVDFLWSLTAVTIAAQILTLPISIYHFHQMPLLFLFTNFIAVPVSSIIVLGEILLCTVFFLPVVASFVGVLLSWLIAFMNGYIEGLNRLPFAVWGALSINILQTICLTSFVTAFCYWLMDKNRRYVRIAFASFAVFMLERGVSFYNAYKQKQLIVYNVPKHPAIDIINGRSYVFIGDSSLLLDGFERNFHLQPSRILHRISPAKTETDTKYFTLNGKRVLILDQPVSIAGAASNQPIDLLVLSKNPKIYLSQLLTSLPAKQVVIDGSVPAWKAARWKHDCDSLRIPCYNVAEAGAFVINW